MKVLLPLLLLSAVHLGSAEDVQQRCFQSNEELRVAVQDYVFDSTPFTDVATTYGWPISSWCVTYVSDFSNIFAYLRFDEDIADWDVSNAVSFEGMFFAGNIGNRVCRVDSSHITFSCFGTIRALSGRLCIQP